MHQVKLDKIIGGCLKNRRKEQQQLYEYTYTSLAVVVSMYTKDNTERDWVFNAGMMKIYSRLTQFKRGTNYLGWARTILVFTAIDHHRKSLTHQTVDLATEVIVPQDFQVLNNALNDLEVEVIMSYIKKLPAREKTIFNLFIIEGYSHKEIEQLTGINQNTSKWILNKAKKQMQEYLSDYSHKSYVQ